MKYLKYAFTGYMKADDENKTIYPDSGLAGRSIVEYEQECLDKNRLHIDNTISSIQTRTFLVPGSLHTVEEVTQTEYEQEVSDYYAR